jgi:GT2 family glycosyltransferase
VAQLDERCLQTEAPSLELSVVIVNFNTADLLRSCLESVFASSGPSSYEVIVVDNGSSDDSVSMVRQEFPRARLIANEANCGYACANNIGLCEARGRYMLLLNPDTVLPQDALARMLDFMGEHPDAGVSGPKLILADGSLDLACRRSFPTVEVAFYRLIGLSRRYPKHPRYNRYNLGHLDPDQVAEVDSVVGAFMLMRRQALTEAGLLDERFFMYAEDIDLCYRIKVNHGWKVYYNPQVEVTHFKSRATVRRWIPMTVYFYRAMWLFHRKHNAQHSSFLLNGLTAMGLASLCCVALAVNLLRSPQKRKVGI